MVGRQRPGEQVHVVVQHAVRGDRSDQAGDRVVPAAEPPLQLGGLVVVPQAGRCGRAGVAVDLTAGQRENAEYLAPPPRLGGLGPAGAPREGPGGATPGGAGGGGGDPMPPAATTRSASRSPSLVATRARRSASPASTPVTVTPVRSGLAD